MRRAVLGFLGLTLSSLVGCGGIAQGGGADPNPDPDGSMSTARGGSNDGDSFGNADTAVGDCVEGPLEADAGYDMCAWVAKGRCYVEREKACNCACPHDRDSQCSSGFESGANGHVKVSCF
ncbi:MAG TPA: hypothetical protein VHB79_16095 [Polyangiaceae bacterium]|nr:hypothetical protein [Polyangiaceae bacterium]